MRRLSFESIVILGLLCLAPFVHAAPAGWRGDGTGQYPDSTPPTVWSKSADGKTKNVLWQTKFPHYSWASPIIVGDRIFVRSEPYDMVCLDKNTGKVLWMRAHGPNEGVSEEDRKHELWPEVTAAAAKLDEANKAIYLAGDLSQPAIEKKYAAQKQLNDLVGKINRKYRMVPEMWRGKWSGYTGATPCTDGKNIYFISAMGVVGCYDLAGNKKWMFSEPVTAGQLGEHGCGSSPAIVGDMLVYCLNTKVVALDKQTGKENWRQEFDGSDGGPSITSFVGGGKTYIIAKGRFLNAQTGVPVEFKDDHLRVMAMNASPVIVGNTGYFQDAAGRLIWFKWEVLATGEIHIKRIKLLEFPLADESKRWDNAVNFWVPSPVVVDGLVYCLSNNGRMVIVDPAAEKIVYDKVLDLSPDLYKSGMHGGYVVGVCASPTVAGKHIHIMDNTGITLVLEPGREPRTLARNRIEQIVDPWDPKHYDKPHQEATLSSPVFEGGRMYYRGELMMYCIGEK